MKRLQSVLMISAWAGISAIVSLFLFSFMVTKKPVYQTTIATCHELASEVIRQEPAFRRISGIVDLQGIPPISEEVDGVVKLSCGGNATVNGAEMIIIFYLTETKNGEEILVEGSSSSTSKNKGIRVS